jgi:hypothetical protein
MSCRHVVFDKVDLSVSRIVVISLMGADCVVLVAFSLVFYLGLSLP